LAAIKDFLKWEAAGSVVLLAAALLALILSNSGAAGLYDTLLQMPFGITLGDIGLTKPLLLWINDGLMAIFFFLVGLEIKREVLEGELSSLPQLALPGLAALGGMVVPAAIFALVNWPHPANLDGWAIPAATDIAFAIGILGLVGARAPLSLKIFLLALAILDDLGAIIVIAIFFTADLSLLSLALAGVCTLVLILFNRLNVQSLAAYILVGIVMWVCDLKSGVHATLAGVVLAFTIPLRNPREPDQSMLRRCEHALHPWISFGIMPVFAFANAGVSLSGIGPAQLLDPVALGVAGGLFIGKQAGVFAMTWLCVRLGFGKLPQGATWLQVYGVAMLTGIGFTMSLFIGSLAFTDPAQINAVKIGVLGGSILSASCGFVLLRYLAKPGLVASPPAPARARH
jgi:NhaA family Na+:H+ antiporter